MTPSSLQKVKYNYVRIIINCNITDSRELIIEAIKIIEKLDKIRYEDNLKYLSNAAKCDVLKSVISDLNSDRVYKQFKENYNISHPELLSYLKPTFDIFQKKISSLEKSK